MATKKQKQQLIDRIKHGVKKYKFSIQRYGGEMVMGTITPEQYEYWNGGEDKLQEYVMGFDRTDYERENEIPEDAKFNREWFELDDVAHVCGGYVSKQNFLHIEEFDQDGNAMLDSAGNLKYWEPIELDPANMEKLGIQLNEYECYDLDHPKVENKHYFVGCASNKGGWSTTDFIEVDGELDLSKLKLHCQEIEGELICNGISYAGGDELLLEEDSTGSSMWCKVLEGNVNESKLSKAEKKQRAKNRVPTLEEQMAFLKAHMESMNSGKNKTKKKVKTKKTVKGKKQTKKKKEKK